MHRITTIAFLASALSLSAAPIGVTANGACVAGTCPPSVLAAGNSATQNFDYTLTLPDQDAFRVFGFFTASSIGEIAGAVNHDFEVVYLGNPGGGPTSASDSITVEGLYALPTSLSSENVYRAIVGAFGGGIGDASTGSTCVAGGTLGCVNVHAPGAFDDDSSDFTLYPVSRVFEYDPYFTSNFAAGSPVGSYIIWGQTTPLTAPTPEPASLALMAFGFCSFAFTLRRLRKTASSPDSIQH